jgi:hypothetical protein
MDRATTVTASIMDACRYFRREGGGVEELRRHIEMIVRDALNEHEQDVRREERDSRAD